LYVSHSGEGIPGSIKMFAAGGAALTNLTYNHFQ
jgi:hypothetical protein